MIGQSAGGSIALLVFVFCNDWHKGLRKCALGEKAAQQIEGFLAETSRKLSVTFDDASNRYITRVINRSTGEVIRTIPEEETIKVAQSIQGQMVNLRA